MAAPITIVNWFEVPSAIYTNVHALIETNSGLPRDRMLSWNNNYFPILTRDGDVEGQIDQRQGRLGLIWQVPTLALLNSPTLQIGSSWEDGDYADQFINLIQNTIWAIAFYTKTATQDADIVAAFNTAWT